VPVADSHVEPPSVETSTKDKPEPVSDAVPDMTQEAPFIKEPSEGRLMMEEGATLSTVTVTPAFGVSVVWASLALDFILKLPEAGSVQV
jgi:hypothetical protein